jgi:hypothetical protein
MGPTQLQSRGTKFPNYLSIFNLEHHKIHPYSHHERDEESQILYFVYIATSHTLSSSQVSLTPPGMGPVEGLSQ